MKQKKVAVAHCRSFGVAGFWVQGLRVSGLLGFVAHSCGFGVKAVKGFGVAGFWVQGIDEHDVIGQFKHTSHSIQNMLADSSPQTCFSTSLGGIFYRLCGSAPCTFGGHSIDHYTSIEWGAEVLFPGQ